MDADGNAASVPDEFAEFDTTEEEFDRMLAEGQPVEIINKAHGWVTITEPGPFTVQRIGACSFNLYLPAESAPSGGDDD